MAKSAADGSAEASSRQHSRAVHCRRQAKQTANKHMYFVLTRPSLIATTQLYERQTYNLTMDSYQT